MVRNNGGVMSSTGKPNKIRKYPTTVTLRHEFRMTSPGIEPGAQRLIAWASLTRTSEIIQRREWRQLQEGIVCLMHLSYEQCTSVGLYYVDWYESLAVLSPAVHNL
jgi:hypothetical protein